MTAVWQFNLSKVQKALDGITSPPFDFKSFSDRQRGDIMRDANNVFMEFLEKLVGPDREVKSEYLYYQLKRVSDKGTHNLLSQIINSSKFDSLPAYDTLSEGKKKYHRKGFYKVFDEFLKKVSGASTMRTQRNFLSALSCDSS